MDRSAFHIPNVFSPEEIAAIRRAYQNALIELSGSGFGELHAELAKQIMTLAKSGELNERRLIRLSVAAVMREARRGPSVSGAPKPS